MKTFIVILFFIIISCKTSIYIPNYTAYSIVDRNEFLDYVGDFEKIKFIENEHILVYTSFNGGKSNTKNSYSMRVRVPSKYNLMHEVSLKSKYFGDFPIKEKTKNVYNNNFDEVIFIKSISKIAQRTVLDSIYSDTLRLKIGTQITYDFVKAKKDEVPSSYKVIR